jgi:hypothetical protein
VAAHSKVKRKEGVVCEQAIAARCDHQVAVQRCVAGGEGLREIRQEQRRERAGCVECEERQVWEAWDASRGGGIPCICAIEEN